MFDLRLWREALAHLASRIALLLTIASSAAAGVVTVLQAYLLSQVIAAVFLKAATRPDLQTPLAALLLVIILRALLVAAAEASAHRVALTVKEALRARLFAHLLALGPLRAQGERSGELVNTLVEGIEALEAYLNHYLPQLVLATLIPLTVLFFVFPTDLLSGIVLLVTAPLIPLFMVLIGKAAEKLTERQWSSLSLMSAHFHDVLRGLTTLKRLGQAEAQVRNVAQISDRFRQLTMGVLRMTFLSALALELISTLSVAIVAVAIGLRLLEGQMAFVDALFILVIAPEFYLPLRMLGARFHAGMEGVQAANRIFALLEMPLPQPPQPQPASTPPAGTAPITLENVHVTYPGREEPALANLSLTIEPGQTVALVGASGAGKSTITHLLLRFLEPDAGQIKVGETPLSTLDPADWRSQLAWVPQSPYLFHDTVAANIRLGRPEAGEEEVIAAARQAHAHTFIQALPEGYDTVIGEEGARLSGGQAQRLALARAFLKDAPLLILDEPTAHLDPETEALLQEATAALIADRTVLLIAHRLNTVVHADQLIVLDQGKIVQQGNHAQLAAEPGPYRRLLAGKERRGNNKIGNSRIGDGTRRTPIVSETSRHSPLPTVHSPLPTSRAPLSRLLRLVTPLWPHVALSVLLGALTVGSSIGLLATSAYLISAAALQPSIADVNVAIVGVRFFGITRGLFRYLERLVSHNLTFRLLARLRTWFYAALVPLAPARLLAFHSGDLLGRITADVATLEDFYVRALAPPLVAVVITATMIVFMGAYAGQLAVALLLFLLLAGLGLPLAIRLAGKKPGRALIAARAALQVHLVDGILGMAELLAYGRSGTLQQEVRLWGAGLAAVEKRMGWIAAGHAGLSLLLSNGAMVAILWLAIPLVTAGQIAGVSLAGLALATLAAFEAVQPLPLAAQHLESSAQAAARLFEIVDAKPAVVDPPAPRPLPARAPSGLDLAVRDLTFRYGDQAPPALDHVSFDLPAGKWLAVVGPSGAGKSTLAHLLLRFWEVDQGHILLAGHELHSYRQLAVRRLLGVIAQQTTLFNASIRDNLRVANPHADEAELRAAVRRARLAPFVESLPGGLETRIGERGLQISGGQRQRLAIARVLLQDPPFLILDEPTANLDPVTERDVLESIFAYAQDRSLLLITHRLVGLERMDEILVLDRGRVVERGRHGHLLAAGGLYRRLWELQQNALSLEY